MDAELKKNFLQYWSDFFPGAELPIGFYYSDSVDTKSMAKQTKGHRCIIADLTNVRKGKVQVFDTANIGCAGGKRYCGFDCEITPNFEYFLSHGIPGKLEGERYKKTPEIVQEFIGNQKPLPAPAKYIVFKRFDDMDDEDHPSVIIFFASPDVLSGLFTLANFDEVEPNGVIAPFGAGCATIIDYPYKEFLSSGNRAVLGMFDVSARPCVPSGTLTFAVCWPRFIRMVKNVEESFLITKSWDKVRARIKKLNLE